MIQRIQSIFLLLAGACFLGQFGTSIASTSESNNSFLSDQIYNVLDHPVLIGMCALGGLIAIVAIFLFNNRRLQKRLSLLSLVIAILFPIVSYWLFMQDSASLTGAAEVNDQIGTYLPFPAIVLLILAMIYIGKDDKLVKSMDRLR